MAMTQAQKHRAAKTRERALARAAERRRLARVERELADRAQTAAAAPAVVQPVALPMAVAMPPSPPPQPQPQGGLMSNAMLMPGPGSRLPKAQAMAAMLRANERIRGEPISVAHDD